MSPTQPSRRQAVTTVGALGLGVVGAASACGSGEASTAASQAVDQASSAVAGAGSQAASAAAQAIAKADIPVGGGRIIDALKVVITQPTEGDYKAFTSICPHQGCPVTSVEGGTINCPCHGSKFDISTGEVKAGPAKEGLAKKSISVTADGISLS